MLIIPAIDLLGGSCVRLLKGNYNAATRYTADPVETAQCFADAGIKRMHVVDLDAARGQGNNRKIIKDIRHKVPITLEVGGGIRAASDVQELLDAGVDRLIVGTMIVRDPDEVSRWIDSGNGVFIAGIDADLGKVKVDGWEQGSGITDTDLAVKAAEMGFVSILYTCIDKDGTLSGPGFNRTLAMAEASGLPVILSGGVSSMDDLEEAAGYTDRGIKGAITGKAYYEGKIDLERAVRLYQQEESGKW